MAVIGMLFPYRLTIRTITTDNRSEFSAHKLMSKALSPKGTKNPNLVHFADSYSSWQKGAIENAGSGSLGGLDSYINTIHSE